VTKVDNNLLMPGNRPDASLGRRVIIASIHRMLLRFSLTTLANPKNSCFRRADDCKSLSLNSANFSKLNYYRFPLIFSRREPVHAPKRYIIGVKVRVKKSFNQPIFFTEHASDSGVWVACHWGVLQILPALTAIIRFFWSLFYIIGWYQLHGFILWAMR